MTKKPLILAPAGNTDCFLAALAAGADAVYCGLKHFSARQAAINFTLPELAQLTQLAHQQGVHVYVALNTLIKPDELDTMAQTLDQLSHQVQPDAIIFQDLAIARLAAQVGFKGELHLSTLANVSFAEALTGLSEAHGISRVVIPRELSIDEIKTMAQACPPNMDLEVFVHGALCYAVSGRCYWSSFLGGKSGLRGRCVQPCRRAYRQKGTAQRLFSCLDLSLDVLTKVLAAIDKVCAWKIEGRRKGPHYVFHTVSAYRLLRDEGRDPAAKKLALHLLEQALGRQGTHYGFLPQRPQLPVRTDQQTGSGKLIGKIQGPAANPYLTPREEILRGDLLRIGYEDDAFHSTFKVSKQTPKRGRLHLKIPTRQKPKSGAPIFLLDRRDKTLKQHLSHWQEQLDHIPPRRLAPSNQTCRLGRHRPRPNKPTELSVHRKPQKTHAAFGLWLALNSQSDAYPKFSKRRAASCWIWLSPVIWPNDAATVQVALKAYWTMGVRYFVVNAPWQHTLFVSLKGVRLWAGPFCNISNPLAIQALAHVGYSGVIASPELGQTDYAMLAKHSELPLGVVLSGMWPLCLSRIVSEQLKNTQPFTSPKGEEAWVQKIDTTYWVYPNWRLDLNRYKDLLQKAGVTLFVHLEESLPRALDIKKRPGIWNWSHGLQ